MSSGPLSSGIVVRRAHVADARAIAEVHVRSWQQSYRGMIADDALDRLDVIQWEAHHWDRLRAPERDAETFVAETAPEAGQETGGTVVGMAICGRGRHAGHESEGELAALYVDTAHHRRGAGTALTQAVLEHLANSGFTTVYLWVLEANIGSQEFYRRMGFTPTGESQLLRIREADVPEVCWARTLPR